MKEGKCPTCGGPVMVGVAGSKKPIRQQLREREKLLRDYEISLALAKETRNERN